MSASKVTSTDSLAGIDPFATHEVTNQSRPLEDFNVFGTDKGLTDAAAAFTSEAAAARLNQVGLRAGSAEIAKLAEQADTNKPVLKTHDRFGNRIDEVEFHPAWHELMREAVGAGLAGAAWDSDEPDAHAERAAGFITWYQTEAGHGCPISMTYAVVPALRTEPGLDSKWVKGATSRIYDFGLSEPGSKAGLIAGMSMTEKQGGSDVRLNTSTAQLIEGTTDQYLLNGHKWFCSAPMSDMFLVLAQAPGGLTCFLVPRVLSDGTRNVFRIQRLKDKLGNHSNASSEIEFGNTWAQRVGEEGRGVRTIVEMVSATRLDCVLGSTALMRKAVREAVWHASHRAAFGAKLIDQPLMRRVLADLAIESEAATWLSMRLASATDHALDSSTPESESEAALRRISLPFSKYFVCKRTPFVVAEAMECLGGAGYVEESGLPRIYREAPLNSIWEGSGNVNALDLLRALGREPETLDAWLAEVGKGRGVDAGFDAALTTVLDEFAHGSPAEQANARLLAEQMALLLQGAILAQFAPNQVTDAFMATRFAPHGAPRTFGAFDQKIDEAELIRRVTDQVDVI